MQPQNLKNQAAFQKLQTYFNRYHRPPSFKSFNKEVEQILSEIDLCQGGTITRKNIEENFLRILVKKEEKQKELLKELAKRNVILTIELASGTGEILVPNCTFHFHKPCEVDNALICNNLAEQPDFIILAEHYEERLNAPVIKRTNASSHIAPDFEESKTKLMAIISGIQIGILDVHPFMLNLNFFLGLIHLENSRKEFEQKLDKLGIEIEVILTHMPKSETDIPPNPQYKLRFTKHATPPNSETSIKEASAA